MTGKIETLTIGSYLIQRLKELGVTHVFGVPGDFSLRFCKLLEDDDNITFVGTTREDTAGFAADGYARRHEGLGVVLVTHGVGALSIVNPIAGANAESSPFLVISGAPGVAERAENPLIHHSFGSPEAQMKIFENFTCSAIALNDLSQAPRQIDQVIESVWRNKKPGYIEIPRDMVDKEIHIEPSNESFCQFESSEEATLDEALSETASLLNQAKSPVILAGVEVHRHGIQNELVQLLEVSQLPIAATIMGKSVVNEHHPLYLGVYQGQVGSEEAREIVEASDLVITLGVMFTDVNLGMYTARLDPNQMVRANQGTVRIKHHEFPKIILKDFILGLTKRLKSREPVSRTKPRPIHQPSVPEKNSLQKDGDLTMTGIIEILNQQITPEMAIVVDTGDCLFAAAELRVPDRTSFFASAFYTTMGFAVPAAVGVNCASPGTRPLILVGDGAFQMTGTELSTCKKLNLTPIVVVINNMGYETERVILDGKFNDIENWDYGAICKLINYGKEFRVETAGEFQTVMENAIRDKNNMVVINAIVKESSRGMRLLASEISRRLQSKT